MGVLNLLEHSVSERLNVLRQKRGEYDNDKYKILKEQREKYFKEHMDEKK